MADLPDGAWNSWLRQLVAAARIEADGSGHEVVDGRHLMLAATHPELGTAPILEAAGVDVGQLRRLAAGVGPPPTKAPGARTRPTSLAADARGVVAVATEEARAVGQDLGPTHFLVGLAKVHVAFGTFGVFTNDIRRAAGLPVPDRPPPLGIPPAPRARGSLVIDGGGQPATRAGAVLELVASDERTPTVAFIGAAFPWAGHPVSLARAVGDVGGRLVDTGSPGLTPEAVCDVVARADVVFLAGGYHRYLVDYLVLGPVGEALVAASDAGAVVWGTSAGAVALGVGGVDLSGDEGPAVHPGLGWIDAAIVPHYKGDPEQVDAHIPARAQINAPILLVPHDGALLVDPGWQRFAELVVDPCGVGPWWWPQGDQAPHPLAPLSHRAG